MTTYTTIPNSSLEPGKPIRSIDGIALRDNPIAITEGASGAPRIVGAAAKRLDDFSALSVTASDAYQIGSGILTEAIAPSTFSTSNPPTVIAFRFTIQKYTGSMRFKCSHYTTASTATSRLSLYKNNVLVQAYTTTSIALVQRSNDVTSAPGDVFEWRHSTSNASYASNAEDAQVTASDQWTTRPLWIPQSLIATP